MMIEVGSPSVFWSQWTFRNCVTVQASVNEVFYNKDFIVEFMCRVKAEQTTRLPFDMTAVIT